MDTDQGTQKNELEAVEQVPELIKSIYAIVKRLEALFPGRRFTPDGHLVGSLGEVLAAHRYGLTLLPASSEGHDATNDRGLRVQIKATQRRSIGIRSEPEHLLALQIKPDGSFEEIYNGPGGRVWKRAGSMQKNGQRNISLTMLRALMDAVDSEERLPVVR